MLAPSHLIACGLPSLSAVSGSQAVSPTTAITESGRAGGGAATVCVTVAVAVAVAVAVTVAVTVAVGVGIEPWHVITADCAAVRARWQRLGLRGRLTLSFGTIVILAFGLILGSAAVAVALAFGLGGRDAAARLLERYADENAPSPRRRPRPPRIERSSAAEDEDERQPPLV